MLSINHILFPFDFSDAGRAGRAVRPRAGTAIQRARDALLPARPHGTGRPDIGTERPRRQAGAAATSIRTRSGSSDGAHGRPGRSRGRRRRSGVPNRGLRAHPRRRLDHDADPRRRTVPAPAARLRRGEGSARRPLSGLDRDACRRRARHSRILAACSARWTMARAAPR